MEMLHSNTRDPALARRSRMGGSAAVEFIVMAPFILAMMLLIWNLRQYTAYRTDVVREMYVAAELIANETGSSASDNPIPIVVERVMDKLGNGGSGTIDVALITRGDRRLATATVPHPDCATPGEWCLPRVALKWPPHLSGLGTWDGGGDCASRTTHRCQMRASTFRPTCRCCPMRFPPMPALHHLKMNGSAET